MTSPLWFLFYLLDMHLHFYTSTHLHIYTSTHARTYARTQDSLENREHMEKVFNVHLLRSLKAEQKVGCERLHEDMGVVKAIG